GAWYAGRPTLPPTPHVEAAQPSATGSGTRHAPPQDPFGDRKVEGLYVTHELTAPAAPALDSFIASGSHVLLFLQVRNGGTHAVRVLDGLVAQEGAEPDQSAGGLSAGTSSGRPLEPGRTAEIFVRVQLACGSALQGPPATRLLLVSQAEGRRPLMQ